MIQRNAAMLSRVVGDLLELARIENSNEPVTREPVNPRLSLHEALETCGALAAEKEIRFRIDMPETAMVTANEHLLGQVFRNLLENACRYAPQGSEVGIAGERHDTEMVFTVSDHGPGIPQASLGRIFERFYQVEKERNSATAGLGLAISKHIVERLHGRIWAESPYNDASTALRFTLPLVQNPAHPHDGPQGDTALADHSEQPKDQGAA